MKGKVSLIVFATVVAQMAFAPNSQAQITIAPTTSTSIVPITTTSVTQVFNPLTELFEPKTTTTTTFQTTTTTTPANVSTDVAAGTFVANQNTNSISDSNTIRSLLPTHLAVLAQQPTEKTASNSTISTSDQGGRKLGEMGNGLIPDDDSPSGGPSKKDFLDGSNISF